MSNSTQLPFLQGRYGYLPSTFHPVALPIVFSLFLLLQTTILAQVPKGAIRGVVKDVTGAIVTEASVRVGQLDYRERRAVATNAYGHYYVTNLEPGDYEIEASAPGFNTEVQHATLRVADELTVNFQLHPGSVNERVLVSGQTSGINTTDFAVNGSVSQVQVQNLPLNGRNFLELARLEPGVNVVSVTNPGTFANNYSRVSIAGAQYLLTEVSVDGVTVSDRMNGGTAQNFSQETVQDFQVERFSFDPTLASGANISLPLFDHGLTQAEHERELLGKREPHLSGKQTRHLRSLIGGQQGRQTTLGTASDVVFWVEHWSKPPAVLFGPEEDLFNKPCKSSSFHGMTTK